MREVAIIGVGMHPFGRFDDKPYVEIGREAAVRALKDAGIEWKQVQAAYCSCMYLPATSGVRILSTLGRTGIPIADVEAACASGGVALKHAYLGIASGQYDVIVAGGAEAMSRVPMFSTIQNGPGEPWTDEIKERYHPVPQGLSAEEIAQKWGLTRQDLDAYSLESHHKAAAATQAGWFKREIVPMTVTLDDGTVEVMDNDEGIRYDTSLEKLAKLRPVYPDGICTAGNSSSENDGAAALVLTTPEATEEHKAAPIAYLRSFAAAGADPTLTYPSVPIAVNKALEKAGVRRGDIIRVGTREWEW